MPPNEQPPRMADRSAAPHARTAANSSAPGRAPRGPRGRRPAAPGAEASVAGAVESPRVESRRHQLLGVVIESQLRGRDPSHRRGRPAPSVCKSSLSARSRPVRDHKRVGRCLCVPATARDGRGRGVLQAGAPAIERIEPAEQPTHPRPPPFVARRRHYVAAPARHRNPRRPGTARAPARSAPPRTAAAPPAARRTTPRPSAGHPRHLEHRPDQHPVHLAHERVGLDPELEHVAARRRPPVRGEHLPREALVLVSVGVNAVKSCVADQRSAHTRQRADDPADAATTAPAPPRTRSAPPAPAPGSSTPAKSHRAAHRTRPQPQSTTAPPHRRAARAFNDRTDRRRPGIRATCPQAWTPASVRPATVSAHAVQPQNDRQSAAPPPPEPSAPRLPRPARQNPAPSYSSSSRRRTARHARPARAAPSRSSPTGAAPASGSACSRPAARCTAARSPRTACRR